MRIHTRVYLHMCNYTPVSHQVYLLLYTYVSEYFSSCECKVFAYVYFCSLSCCDDAGCSICFSKYCMQLFNSILELVCGQVMKTVYSQNVYCAKMFTPKMSTVLKYILPKCLLCQNIYSQNVYCAKISTPKMSTVPKYLLPKCLLCQNVYCKNVSRHPYSTSIKKMLMSTEKYPWR